MTNYFNTKLKFISNQPNRTDTHTFNAPTYTYVYSRTKIYCYTLQWQTWHVPYNERRNEAILQRCCDIRSDCEWMPTITSRIYSWFDMLHTQRTKFGHAHTQYIHPYEIPPATRQWLGNINITFNHHHIYRNTHIHAHTETSTMGLYIILSEPKEDMQWLDEESHQLNKIFHL